MSVACALIVVTPTVSNAVDDMSRRLDNLEAKLAQQTDIPVARPKSEKSDN